MGQASRIRKVAYRDWEWALTIRMQVIAPQLESAPEYDYRRAWKLGKTPTDVTIELFGQEAGGIS